MGWFSRKKKAKPAAQGDSFQNNNPYSQETTSSRPDAYDPKPSGGYGGMGGLPPPAYEPGNATLSAGGLRRDNPPQFRDEKSPVPPGGYGRGGGTDSGHFTGAGSYADQQGYGSERYGRDSRTAQPQYQRSGGYGGMGSLNDDNSQDPSRSGLHSKDLFGNAAQRAAPEPAPSTYRHAGSSDSRNFQPPLTHDENTLFGNAPDRRQQPHGDSAHHSSGHSEAPPLTDHNKTSSNDHLDDEDAQVASIGNEGRDLRRQGIESLANSKRVGNQAVETVSRTMERLAQQNESINHIERDFYVADANARTAGGMIKEIGGLNDGSMFRPVARHTKTTAVQDEQYEQEQRAITQQRSAERADDYQRMQNLSKGQALVKGGLRSTNRTESQDQKKYEFEDDNEEDVAKERELQSSIGDVEHIVSRLKVGATYMGVEVDSQNKRLEKVTGHADHLNERLDGHTRKLNKIK